MERVWRISVYWTKSNGRWKVKIEGKEPTVIGRGLTVHYAYLDACSQLTARPWLRSKL